MRVAFTVASIIIAAATTSHGVRDDHRAHEETTKNIACPCEHSPPQKQDGNGVGHGGDISTPTVPLSPAGKNSRRVQNVLLIVLDDFRPDLKAYGHDDAPPTPHIDAFSSMARVFRRAYSNFPDCGPSRTSFLTGAVRSS